MSEVRKDEGPGQDERRSPEERRSQERLSFIAIGLAALSLSFCGYLFAEVRKLQAEVHRLQVAVSATQQRLPLSAPPPAFDLEESQP